MRSRRSWIGWALFAAAAVWLLWMTLRPNQAVATDLAPLTEPAAEWGISVHLLIDFARNVVVFLPLGMAIALALRDGSVGRRLSLATLSGAGLGLIIELIQTTIPSRMTALDDWLLNAVARFWGRWWVVRPAGGRRSEVRDWRLRRLLNLRSPVSNL